ncbi:MAG: hypothetical protein ACREMQ_14990 [Longimicrobiales bacterium]
MLVRKAFVFGRTDRGTTTLIILRIANGPIIGPWTVKAVVSKN